ncbi:MAG: hypothetical protein KC636_13470 [Myxococcales bacterium]|nr:hypothetical protein [Myxococcales bacterium]
MSLGVGELKVRSGACQLAHADLQYDRAVTDTRIRYEVVGDRGTLVLEERTEGRTRRHRGSDWSVCLGDVVPIDLTVDLGVGNSELHLGGVDLRSLNVDMGTGNAEVDLRGPIAHNVEVRVDGGVGNLKIHVPAQVGVRIRADAGVGNMHASGFHRTDGALVNDAYGTSPVSIEVSVDVGVGNIRVSQG